MKLARLVLSVICLSVAIVEVTAAEDILAEESGLAVGRVAPGFSLTNQFGKEVSLEAMLGKGPVAVVFHRSVDWCMYCKLQMVQLQKLQKEIASVGGQVAAISYDSTEKIKIFSKRQKITFPLLSDVKSEAIDAFGVRSTNATPEYSGYAQHATFVLDQKGVIRSKIFRLSYQEGPGAKILINALKDARKPSTGETNQ